MKDQYGVSNSEKKKIFFIKNKRNFFISSILVAASIMILIFGWNVYQSNAKPRYQNLLAEALNDPHNESILRKGSVEVLRIEGAQYYNNRDYKAAAAVFEQIKIQDDAIGWDFYLGLCYLYQSEPDRAIPYFDISLNQPNTRYTRESNWYLGLAYLAKEQFPAAKRHFERVANASKNESTWKVKEAKDMIKAIDEFLD